MVDDCNPRASFTVDYHQFLRYKWSNSTGVHRQWYWFGPLCGYRWAWLWVKSKNNCIRSIRRIWILSLHHQHCVRRIDGDQAYRWAPTENQYKRGNIQSSGQLYRNCGGSRLRDTTFSYHHMVGRGTNGREDEGIASYWVILRESCRIHKSQYQGWHRWLTDR